MTPSGRPVLYAAAAACTVAALVFANALGRAFDTGPPGPATPPGTPADTAAANSPDERPLSMDAIMLAIENDPFQPERTRSARRYRLPGDVDLPPPPPPPVPPPPPDFRIVGTAVTPDGGFAVMGVGDAPARVLAIGDYLAGYRLERVAAESALMKNDEREITLTVPGPSPDVAAAAGPQRAGRQAMPERPGMQNRPGQQNPREALMQAQLLEALLERARAQGANPQMLQTLQRLLEQRGIEGMRDMDVQIQGGNMTIRRRMPPDSVPAPERRPPND
jgi:hypothetical protein